MVDDRHHATESNGPGSTKTKTKRSRAVSSPTAATAEQPAKRSRVSRACDQCRASREKCDGVKPCCNTCNSQKRACTYDEPPKKRGIQPNYIRTLELALAWLFRSVPSAQSTLARNLAISGSTQGLIGGKDAAAAEALHQAWRDSLVCRQVDQMLSGAPIEHGEVDPAVPDSELIALLDAPDVPASSTNAEPTLHHHVNHAGRSDAAVTDQSGKESTSTTNTSFQPRNDSTATASEDQASDLKLKLPQNSWTLLEYYFAFTQSWLPMTEKHAVLRTMYSYPAEGLTHQHAQAAGEHAELWSILALASFQLSAPDGKDYATLRDIARSLIPPGHGISGTASSGDRFEAIEKGHIRALLVLSLLGICCQSWQTAWLEVGLAGRLVLYRYAQGERSTGDRAEKPVLHLAAFVIENTIARKLGLTPHIRTDSIRGFDILDEDGLEEWAPWADPTSSVIGQKAPSKAFSTFNALVHELRYAEESMSPDAGNGTQATVLALLENACKREQRTQPSVLAAKLRSPKLETSMPAIAFDAQGGADPMLRSATGIEESFAGFPSHQPSLAFPTDQTLGTQGNPPQADMSGGTSSLASVSTWPAFEPGAASVTGGNDIFEELAMLDSIEPSGQNPQFMQNLGFGPDLDLAEFFGSDYQPSNPLLAYMQPQSGNKPGGDFG